MISILVKVVLALPVDSTTLKMVLGLSNLTTKTTAIKYYYGVVKFTITDCERGGVNKFLTRKVNASVLRMPGVVERPLV